MAYFTKSKSFDTSCLLLGTLFSNMKSLEVDPVADDSQLAAKMLAVSSYWSGLLNKEDLIKNKQVIAQSTTE